MLIRNWLIKHLEKALVFVFFLTSFSSCNFISNRILTKPVVQIEQHRLSAQEFSSALATKLKGLDALSAKDPKIVGFYKNQIINDFVISAFIDLWFEENKLRLTQDEIDKEVTLITSTYPSDAAFQEMLGEVDLGFSEWTKKLQSDIKKKKLLAALTKNLPVPTEDEMQNYYNNNRIKYEQVEAVLLDHIHLNDLNEASVVKKLLVRQNFSDVAKKYSKSYNAESGSQYGWVEKSFSPELEKAFKLRGGDVFGPVTLTDGIHLFKIMQKRPNKIKSFAEARSQISSEIRSLRETAKFTAWLDEQIKKYKVMKNLGIIDSVRVETR